MGNSNLIEFLEGLQSLVKRTGCTFVSISDDKVAQCVNIYGEVESLADVYAVGSNDSIQWRLRPRGEEVVTSGDDFLTEPSRTIQKLSLEGSIATIEVPSYFDNYNLGDSVKYLSRSFDFGYIEQIVNLVGRMEVDAGFGKKLGFDTAVRDYFDIAIKTIIMPGCLEKFVTALPSESSLKGVMQQYLLHGSASGISSTECCDILCYFFGEWAAFLSAAKTKERGV